MTTPIGVGSGSTTSQQARGQKQAANTIMFVFHNIHSLYNQYKPIESSTVNVLSNTKKAQLLYVALAVVVVVARGWRWQGR
jgi:hypothetical protein